jgi:hypothetical protein
VHNFLPLLPEHLHQASLLIQPVKLPTMAPCSPLLMQTKSRRVCTSLGAPARSSRPPPPKDAAVRVHHRQLSTHTPIVLAASM